ncbi:MAG: GatB/YqeY domain-containing protein [Parvibaculum sp.]|nr:GatB/YqeY domain-containing protein [Parvibaculum sp.]|tara:strand:- start:3131 stop:3595 length:465 start_codon:yes stop_codon:yes gene_type:complete
MSDGLRGSIMQAMKDAMKAGDKPRLSTIRLMQSAIKDKDIASRVDGRNDGVPDADLLELFTKMVKQRRESAEMYEKGARPDLVDKERAEIAVLEEFMPQQMDEAATKAAVEAVVADVGATSVKDMGKVMGALKTRYAGQMDFGKAGAVVKAILG